MMRVIIPSLTLLLMACSRENAAQGNVDHVASELDLTEEYESVQGIWGRCNVKRHRYEEIQFSGKGFIKRVIYYSSVTGEPWECAAGKEIFEFRASGVYEIESDVFDDPDFWIRYQNTSIDLQYFENEAASQANGISIYPDLAEEPVCENQRVQLGKFISMLGDTCRDPLLSFLSKRYPITPFEYRGKLLISGDQLLYRSGLFDYLINATVRKYGDDDDSSNTFLMRQSEAYKVDTDYQVFSDMAILKQNVQGVWRSCLENEERVINLGANEFTQTLSHYLTYDCTGNQYLVREEYKGTYEIQGYDSETPGAFLIDWHVTEKILQPMDSIGLSMLNATDHYSVLSPICQDLTFSQGIASSVFGKTCQTENGYAIITPWTRYDRLLLHKDGRVYDSNPMSGEGTTTEGRVKGIDWLRVHYTKQGS